MENYQFAKVELKKPISIKELVEDNLSENEFLSKMKEIYLEGQINEYPLILDTLQSYSKTKDLSVYIRLNLNLSENEFLTKMREFYLEKEANINK